MTTSQLSESDKIQGLMKSLNIDDAHYNNDFHNQPYSELIKTKDLIESTLTQLFDVLQYKLKAEMDTPLVIDGFPRDDIDVVSIRLVRVKILRLRNDNSKLLNELHVKMAHHFEIETNESIEESSSSSASSLTPFALIKEVAILGPAYLSGLKEGDKLLEFDDITFNNFDGLKSLGLKVASSINKPLKVKVLRGRNELSLELTPFKWLGHGMLGCLVVPIQ